MASLSKREFLKLMGGFSLGLLPFIGCYNKSEEENNSITSPIKKNNKEAARQYDITDDDVIILKREDADFNQLNTSYNKRIHLIPKYIAVCKTNKGIQFAIQKAKQEKLPICIKSGGHSFEGFSSNNDGMVINLSQMKNITWLKDDLVAIEPGVKLKELHEQVYAKGHLISAGSCGGVGIAGLCLGGGYGFFSRKYGLTCDQLTDATIVTADENIKQASKDDNLLWALKGGGNGNFGVVSSLTFKTTPIPKTFSSYTIREKNIDIHLCRFLLEKYFEITAQFPLEAFGAFVLNGSTLTMLFTNYGTTDIYPLIEQFDSPNSKLSISLDKPLVPALKRFYGRMDPLYFKNASCGYFNEFGDVDKSLDAVFEKVQQHKGIIFQINTLGGNINHPEFEKQSCYPHRAMNYLGELQGYYEQESQEANVVKGFKEIQAILKSNGIDKHYRNYPDINFENWETAYYGNNYATLQKLKSQLDPENLFQYPQSVKPS